MTLSPQNNHESGTNNLIHENLFQDLQGHFEESSREHFHNVLAHASGGSVTPTASPITTTGQAQDNTFHTQYLDHHEFVDAKNHAPILTHIENLVGQASPQELPLIIKYLDRLKLKSAHIENHDFESEGHTEEAAQKHKENAKKLSNALQGIYESVKHRILLNIDPENTEMNQEDFEHLLLEKEAKEVHSLLEMSPDEKISDNHLDQFHKYKEQKASGISDKIDEHKSHHEKKRKTHEKIDELTQKTEGKTRFNRANEEHYARFNNEKILPISIQKSILKISQGFKGVDNWAIIGSAAVATQSERAPENIDDIDISFSIEELDTVLENFDRLKSEGLIFLDKEGKKEGYESKSIKDIGKSEKINGYIDSGIPDAHNPGKNILVEFEAFGESKNGGIMQIGHIERDITLMENEGEKIHFVGPEALVDQYVVNLLYEFEIDSIENYSSSDVKAKDLMRIEKLNRLGCNILDGIIEAISRTCKRYPKEENKLMQTLEKEKNYILMLEKIHESFQHDVGMKASEQVNDNSSPLDLDEENTLETFTKLFETLKDYKWKLRGEYEELLEIDSPEALFHIHKNIERDNKVFEKIFHKIQQSPEGKFLHFMAISRLSEKFLKSIYLRMNNILLTKFSEQEFTKKGLEKKGKILLISTKYNTHSLETFHTSTLDEYRGKAAANTSEYEMAA